MEQFTAVAQGGAHVDAFADELTFVALSPLPALFADGELCVVDANRAACELFRNDQLVGAKLSDLVNSGDDLLEGLSGNGVAQLEFRADNDVITTEVYFRQQPGKGWLIAISDISGRRQAERSQFASEKQKWRIQRTEALERLAGGIAHEFNNFLAVILLQTDMINLQLDDNSPVVNRVNEIKAVANDAASIVRQLLAFGRRQSMNPTPVVLNALFTSSERDLKALVGDPIAIEFDLEPDLGVCFVDHSHIVQAMMYLTLNAREKMPDGGTLKFRTTNIAKGGPLIHKTQSSGSYIQIEVSDTGTSIDTRTAEQIFEPFFATKGSKENAGLALATVYGIVKQAGGYIWVTSTAEGTTFKIQFPRIDEPKATKAVSNKMVSAIILLIDDEMSVRRVAAEALRGIGHRVIEAASGEEAIEIAKNFPESIQLIVA
jgi:two-component system cell cycle sensor histidine kinase/response regulator CckA